MRKLIIAALVAGTAAVPAYAQEAGTFTGPRIEGIVGYDTLRSGDIDDDGVDTGEDDGDESIDGVLYGVQLGYDFDLGGVVAGVEGEFSESSGSADFDETVDGFGGGIEAGRDLYIGGRIGFKASERALVYVKGGYTNTSIESAFETDDGDFEFDSDIDGFRVGAGAEYLFGKNLYGKVEYRYSKYSNLDIGEDDDVADPQFDIDLDRHQVVAGVGLRF